MKGSKFISFIVCILLSSALHSSLFAADQSATNAATVQQVQVVNINVADAEMIADVLTGVGNKKAQAIVAYRTEHGPFLSLEDLLNVKGIGKVTIAKNKHKIQLK